MNDRSSFLGSSDAAAVLGISPYATPLQLWQEKTGRAPPKHHDQARQRILDRGRKLEPIVLEMVMDKLQEQGHDVELLVRNRRYADPEHAFLSCEIDFELLLDGVHINGDCKTVTGFARRHWGEEGSEDVPTHYAAQFMHGLMVTARPRCLVAALIGIDDVAIYWVERDDETIAAMRAKELAFWRDHVLADVPPAPVTYADVTALFPRDDGATVEADDDTARMVERLRDVTGQRIALEKEEERLKTAIGELLGEHTCLRHDGHPLLTWKAQDTKRFDIGSFKSAQPELYTLFTQTTSVRVMRLVKSGAKTWKSN